MKISLKSLRLLALMLLIVVATGVTTSSSPAPQQSPDPACVSTCAGLLYECFLNQGKNNDHACISVYRHCIAQCGKH